MGTTGTERSKKGGERRSSAGACWNNWQWTVVTIKTKRLRLLVGEVNKYNRIEGGEWENQNLSFLASKGGGGGIGTNLTEKGDNSKGGERLWRNCLQHAHAETEMK